MPRTVHIACLQTRPMPDFNAALVEAVDLIERAVGAGAQMIALPEYCGGLRSDGPALRPPAAAAADHPVLQGLIECAARHEVWTLIGSLAIARGNRGRIVNRSYLIDDTGRIVSRYDKIHLFDIRLPSGEIYRESDTVEPGVSAMIADTPFGVVGHSICYDLRFPQLYRALASAGAEILFVPAAFTKKTGMAHWHVLNRARAIENGAFVVAPCATGSVPGGGEVYGHSLIVTPWGEVLADAGVPPGIIHARLDLDAVQEARYSIPGLSSGRPFTVTDASRRVVA